jgi:hypothetical protein
MWMYVLYDVMYVLYDVMYVLYDVMYVLYDVVSSHLRTNTAVQNGARMSFP